MQDYEFGGLKMINIKKKYITLSSKDNVGEEVDYILGYNI